MPWTEKQLKLEGKVRLAMPMLLNLLKMAKLRESKILDEFQSS
jgi:hypothetical protein